MGGETIAARRAMNGEYEWGRLLVLVWVSLVATESSELMITLEAGCRFDSCPTLPLFFAR